MKSRFLYRPVNLTPKWGLMHSYFVKSMDYEYNATSANVKEKYLTGYKHQNTAFGIINSANYFTEIKQTELGQEFSIYPNPSNSFIEVHSNLPIHYWLIDLKGVVVENGKLIENAKIIDLTSLSNGIYLLRAQVGQKMVTRKIVKN